MDWIDQFMAVTDGVNAPTPFRLWAAISAVGASLERRVWMRSALGVTYPNLYVMLVAKPGIGKSQAMGPIEHIMRQLKHINLSPKRFTTAALVDKLSKSMRVILPTTPTGKMYEYSALYTLVSELGVLINAHDLDLLSVINDIFDNPPDFREQRRHVNQGKELPIYRPQLNMLVGAQPGFLASILPEEAWQMGTMSRFIMVFADDAPTLDLFGKIIDREPSFNTLADQMKPWTEIMGQVEMTPESVKCLRETFRGGFVPAPDHPKLESYNNRRFQFLMKLSMIAAVSRTSGLLIEEVDVIRAKDWLLSAETHMPSVFKAMSIKSDHLLLHELHLAVWKKWREEKKLIEESFLYNFFQEKTYAERIPRLIEAAVKGRLIADKGMGMYQPVPRMEWINGGK